MRPTRWRALARSPPMQLRRPLRARSRLGPRHAREDVDWAAVAVGELAGDGAVGMIGGEGLGRGSCDSSPLVSPGAGLRGPCIKDRWGVRQSRGPYVFFFRGVHCARSIAPSRRVFYGPRPRDGSAARVVRTPAVAYPQVSSCSSEGPDPTAAVVVARQVAEAKLTAAR